MTSNNHTSQSVSVTSSARLHMGFFDLNGAIGRKFGSIGLSLAQPNLRLVAMLNATEQQHIPSILPNEVKVKVDRICDRLKQSWGIKRDFEINLSEALPSHAGLGSGTQLALALGTAIARLFQLPYSTAEIAIATGRGGRSGIGIAAFDQGGILIDGGQKDTHTLNRVPPLLARYTFPEAWRILLIMDKSEIGVHGQTETSAFKTLPTFDNALSQQLCHEVLMKAMPALVEQDLQAFGQSIQRLQSVTGDHFAPIQGGRYASEPVSQVLYALADSGVACFGQSSWGPTGFAIFASEAEARESMADLQTRFAALPIAWQLTTANNQGAQVVCNGV